MCMSLWVSRPAAHLKPPPFSMQQGLWEKERRGRRVRIRLSKGEKRVLIQLMPAHCKGGASSWMTSTGAAAGDQSLTSCNTHTHSHSHVSITSEDTFLNDDVFAQWFMSWRLVAKRKASPQNVAALHPHKKGRHMILMLTSCTRTQTTSHNMHMVTYLTCHFILYNQMVHNVNGGRRN